MNLRKLLYPFSILLWFLPFYLNAQTKTTEFKVFNAEGVHYKSYIKLTTGDTTSYTSYHFKGKSIRNITIKTSKESTHLERIVYEYNYIEDTTQLRKSKNINQFIERNQPSQLNFKNRENWSFYVRNDSLYRYDLEEYNPNRRGTPMFTQFHYLKYSDSIITADNYFLRPTEYLKYSTDSIIVKQNTRMLDRYYMRRGKTYVYKIHKNDSAWAYSNDSTKYSDIIYEYNNEPFWQQIFYMLGDEGPIYWFEVIDLEDKLIKWKYDYNKLNEYRNSCMMKKGESQKLTTILIMS